MWQSSLARLRQDFHVGHWQNALPAPHPAFEPVLVDASCENNRFTFEEGNLHWSLCGEVELGLCCAIHVSLFLGEGAHLTSDSILRNDLNIGGWEDTKHCVPLSLVPVAVHLLLYVDYVSLLEGEFPVVLRLEAEDCPGNHLAVLGLLARVQEDCLVSQRVLVLVPVERNRRLLAGKKCVVMFPRLLIYSQLVLLLLVKLAVKLLQLLLLPHLQLRAPLPPTHAVPPIPPHGRGRARRA